MNKSPETRAAEERIGTDLRALMRLPGLSGHEGRVRATIAAMLRGMGLGTRTDRLGNLMATIEGAKDAPDESKLREAAAALLAAFPAADVRVYLLTLAAQDPATWGPLLPIVSELIPS